MTMKDAMNQHKKMAMGQMPKPVGKPTAKC
jgi:hypothetical protein